MNNVAIISGCQYYRADNLHNLIGVNEDINNMHNAMIAYCNCAKENVFDIKNINEEYHKPTGTDIINTISNIANKFNQEPINNLFFYYSGHGILVNNEIKLLPSDCVPELLFGSVSIKDIESALKQFKNVEHIIMIIDTCQEEAVSKGNKNNEITFPQGIIGFYSCIPNQSSYMLVDGMGTGSVYTHFFLKALKDSSIGATVEDISNFVQEEVRQYCIDHNIEQQPRTKLFDVSLSNVIIKKNQNIRQQIKERTNNVYLQDSIWLKDAEHAEGKQTRFETFTMTSIVNAFIDNKSNFCGIASVKGIGKTFLLQVKRIKMSKIATCFPDVKANKNNNWATECIKFSDTDSLFQKIDEYGQLKLLWKYSLVCFILRCWIKKQESLPITRQNKNYQDIIHWINIEIRRNRNSVDTYKFLLGSGFDKLQIIMEDIVDVNYWYKILPSQYRFLQRLGQLVVNDISTTNKKRLVLFLDKIDQAMRQPNSECVLDCDMCSKKNIIDNCKNEKKGTKYCSGDTDEKCPQFDLCCYGCEIYADSHAGKYLRLNDNAVLRKKHFNYWQQLQLALIEAVSEINSDFNGGIQIIYTVRLEAYNYIENIWGDQRAKIMDKTCTLTYSRLEQKQIYQDCIINQNASLLFSPSLRMRRDTLDDAFVGVSRICHPYVENAVESVFDVIYRHSFDRTRDIQDYGQALTENMQNIRSCLTKKERETLVKDIIENTAARLAYSCNKATQSSEHSYYFEKIPIMPSYWADPGNFEFLMKNIDRNLLFRDDMQKICRIINNLDKCPSGGCISCLHHPFSTLKNLGMLGYIVVSENRNENSAQWFMDSKDVTYFHDEDSLDINSNTMYLIHPALTKSIEKLKNDSKIMHFSGFIIGKDILIRQELLKQILIDKSKLNKNNFENKYYISVDV